MVRKKDFRLLKSRDGKLSERLKTEFRQNIVFGNINIMQAGTGVGKNHNQIQEFNPIMVLENGVKVFVWVAPENVVISKTTIMKHVKEFKRKVGTYLVTDLWSPTNGEISNAISRRDEDEVLFIVMTDSSFNRKVNSLRSLFITHGLTQKVATVFDEIHVSGSSSFDTFFENMGLVPSILKTKCVKFSSIEKLIDISWLFGLTATPLKEQIDPNFGSPLWNIWNSVITKDDILLSVSGHRPPKFYDSDDMESILMEFFGYVDSHQTYVNTLRNHYKLPHELSRKFSGMITLETRYKDKEKNHADKFVKFMDDDNMTVPSNWKFDVALDTSTEQDVWRIEHGSITKMSQEDKESEGYFDTDSIVNKMEDGNSRLKFLVLVGKGSIGMDIAPLNFALSLRTFGNKVDKVSIVHKGVQILGRCRRLVVSWEELLPYFDNIYELINYYTNVNFYQAFLPDSDENQTYWRDVQKHIDSMYPSIDEIESGIHKRLSEMKNTTKKLHKYKTLAL
jgi:hypothetical protein